MSNLPSPPFVSVPGVSNFRDLGGYPVRHPTSTRSIRRNFIYRCGEPSRVTQDGIATLHSLNIGHVYDLRSDNEIERSKDAGWGGIKEWDQCERVFVPVFKDKDYSPESLAMRYKDYFREGTEGFTSANRAILKSGAPAYRKILLHIAHEPSKPLIIHCTAGKDRTGAICAIILSLCGVPDSVIAYEYSLTETGLAELREVLVTNLLASPALKDNKSGVLNMLSARDSNMLAILQMIRENFGGPEQYVIEKCGLTMEEVNKIRSNLVVDARPIHQPSTTVVEPHSDNAT